MFITVHLVVFTYLQTILADIIYTQNEDVSFEIVGIFEHSADTQRRAFNESVRYAHVSGRHLTPITLEPYRADSLYAWTKLCSSKKIRPIAIFGPQNPVSDGAVRDQCFVANVPHIQATWQPLDPEYDVMTEENKEVELESLEDIKERKKTRPNKFMLQKTYEPEERITFKKITINFHPEADEISIAYAKLLKYYKWDAFTALYEDNYGLSRIQKILAEHTQRHPVIVHKLNPNGDNYEIFKKVYASQESRILLDCHVDNIERYMNQAISFRLVNPYQHYILVNIDASTFNSKLTQLQCNVTWLSVTDFENIDSAQHYLAQRVGKWSESLYPPVTTFETEALIMDDVANHLLKSLESLVEKKKLENKLFWSPRDHICDKNSQPWADGALFQNEILKTQTQGVTGNIQFDDIGRRVNYSLKINEIYGGDRRTIGQWHSFTKEIELNTNVETSFGNQTSKHFIVISRYSEPYFKEKIPCVPTEEKECPKDEEKYEGFSVDLVKAIFKVLREELHYNYTYEFKVGSYGYGKFDPKTKKWDGLVGELLSKQADLAVCDLTITEERKQVIDFSVPIMSLGISVLYVKEKKVSPGMFSFMNPFSFEVWLYTATAYCLVSIALFVCSRISPADWENPQPCDKDPEELENIWNFKNCLWLTMGSIMTQGCDILPKAIGSRWVCGMWWFFAMIVVQTYIAQLAASMTSALENEPINSVEDLAKQSKVRYGALDGGSTFNFFKNSKDKLYQKMYENMVANSAVLVNSNDEGEKRVLNGRNKYAFFMESSSIEYKLKRNCELKKVGENLDSKDYGIGMPANSPFRSPINTAILKLKESTLLDEIRKTWWENKYGAVECDDKPDDSDVEGDLEMENLSGAFVVLAVGVFLGLLITMAEFMNEVRNIVVKEKVSHQEAFWKELKASLNFCRTQKPVLRNLSRVPSMEIFEKEEQKNQTKRSVALENFLDMMKDMQ